MRVSVCALCTCMHAQVGSDVHIMGVCAHVLDVVLCVVWCVQVGYDVQGLVCGAWRVVDEVYVCVVCMPWCVGVDMCWM